MEARLPLNKVQRIIKFIEELLPKQACTKLELLQLLDHFNFGSRVIIPGRTFVAYLIHLPTTVKELWKQVRLDKSCRDDLKMWLRFLQGRNGVSLFYNSLFTCASDMTLYTDASLLGFGGVLRISGFTPSGP